MLQKWQDANLPSSTEKTAAALKRVVSLQASEHFFPAIQT